MPGALIIDKPEGLTSHDVVARVRRATGTRRVGHAGTLDPFATGVLVCCIGRATRLVQFLVGLDKEYIATVKLGYATDTQDGTGKQITPLRLSNDLDLEDLRRVLNMFTGPQLQTPPMFSAKKVAGERLYRAARAGRCRSPCKTIRGPHRALPPPVCPPRAPSRTSSPSRSAARPRLISPRAFRPAT
jgi:tRNA pseudouridine55 synthase